MHAGSAASTFHNLGLRLIESSINSAVETAKAEVTASETAKTAALLTEQREGLTTQANSELGKAMFIQTPQSYMADWTYVHDCLAAHL